MRFHLISPANVQTTAAYSLDGFSVATRRFARMMKNLGHTVILYASEENDAPCDELVTIITKEEQQTLLGKTPYQYAVVNDKYPLWCLANPRASREIMKRKQVGDFICSISGIAHKSIADEHPDLMFVEYSIGYIGSFSKYRVFESHTWRACTAGFQDDQRCQFLHGVIPYFFDETEYPYRAEKEPFALYVGRLVPDKGISIACQAAKLAGVPLKVIGHGDTSLVTDGAEYLGALSDVERNDYMSRASALLCPTVYVEPFGAMAVEAQLCGTPVVSTDFGAFTETVEQGLTGFRGTDMGEFAAALQHVHRMDPAYIRDRAVRLYSMDAIQPQYQRYFERLQMSRETGFSVVAPAHDNAVKAIA